MMFLRSIRAVFCGFSAFPEFAKRNPFRALFHLFLFCFLLSFLCSGLQSGYINKKVDICTAGLQNRFGRIEISETGIHPEKNKEEPWRFYFPGNIRLDYFSRDTVFSGSEMKDWEQNIGIFWAERGFLVWMRPNPNRGMYYMMPFAGTKEAVLFLPDDVKFFQPVGIKEVAAGVKSYQSGKKVDDISTSFLEFSGIGKFIKIYIYIILSISGGLGNFFLTLVLILMCAGLQALWKAQGLETLKFSGTLSLLSYAALPALTLRMIFDAFFLPAIGEVIFFIVFFVYQMIAFQQVRRSMENGSSGNGTNY